MTTVDLLYLVALVVCLVLSAFFSMVETAYTSIQHFRVEHLVSTNARSASRVARLVERPERFLSTILLGNNLVNTVATALATVLVVKYFPGHGVVISTAAMTLIILVFGEAAPKSIGAHRAEKVALSSAPAIDFFSWLFTPFVFVLSWITSGLTRLVGVRPIARSLVSEEEIRTMISVGSKEGTVEKEQAAMLHRVFEFGDRRVSEVMVPRREVVAIEQGSKVSDFLKLYMQSPVSRFPVFKDNMDNVTGILSIKDVLMALAKGTVTHESPVDELVRPAYFTPESKPIGDLFNEMREKNYHMAIAVDEYGGTAGIASLSRLLEEIVGPVGSELAAAERDYEVINEYTFQIDGNMRIEDADEQMGLSLPEGDYETVAGFVLSLLGRIPRQGEQMRYKGIKIVITKMNGVKIEEILLMKERAREEHAPVTPEV